MNVRYVFISAWNAGGVIRVTRNRPVLLDTVGLLKAAVVGLELDQVVFPV